MDVSNTSIVGYVYLFTSLSLPLWNYLRKLSPDRVELVYITTNTVLAYILDTYIVF